MNIPSHKKAETITKNLFTVSKVDQYRTVGELIEKARPGQTFYVLLILSSVIITGGILVNQIAIIIGGMLVTPLLTPILVVALALSTGRTEMFMGTLTFLLKAVAAIIGGSLILGFIFGGDVVVPVIANSMTATFLYFVIAFASGIAVTYAWIRKETSEVLPGIAIVASLVPPLSWIGVAVSRGAFEIALTFFIIFVLNFIGIVLGSFLVFSLSQFNNVGDVVDKKQKQLEQEEHKKQLEEVKAEVAEAEQEVAELKAQVEKSDGDKVQSTSE